MFRPRKKAKVGDLEKGAEGPERRGRRSIARRLPAVKHGRFIACRSGHAVSAHHRSIAIVPARDQLPAPRLFL